MEELPKLFLALDLENGADDATPQDLVTVFTNPNRWPIDRIHLEQAIVDVKNPANRHKTRTVPALDRSWCPTTPPFVTFHLYNFASATSQANSAFLTNNRLFLRNLNYLLRCDYHRFWCLVLFQPDVAVSLHSFLLNPIIPYEIPELDSESAALYESVFTQFLLVYRRLITFRQSEIEFMSEEVGLDHLLEKKLLTLPTVITLILLYEETNKKFVAELVALYFSHESAFRDKEIDEMLQQVLLTLEMVGGHVCGFEPGSVIVPIAIDVRPKVFSLSWVFSVVNYLLKSMMTLKILLKYDRSAAVPLALIKGVPYRLTYTYEHVYSSLYEMLCERRELEEDPRLVQMIFDEISIGRSEFIDVYNTFVVHCLDEAFKRRGDLLRQQEVVEIYLNLMTTALEDEYFICDYNERYDVRTHNEDFKCCTDIDETRTDYIVDCINSFRRHNRIWKALKQDSATLNKAMAKYARSKRVKAESQRKNNSATAQPSTSTTNGTDFICEPNENEIETRIRMILQLFPHLGDGFVLKCLEAYNFQTDDVIAAILEENLPPHILNIPFDQIRIPPEPEPAKPILAYKGKKPGYDDALKLLNDKRDMKEIKTFVLDGIQYTNEYDMYDDEYDDREGEHTVPVRDHGSEDILRYNPNYEDDAVSDTSYSDNDEYDDRGQPVKEAVPQDRGKNFCEDPALVRARREAQRGGRGRGRGGTSGVRGGKGGGGATAAAATQGKARDVVGKPKGQGQEKDVQINRQKKNTNKSSRANHSRKSGAQWKRSRGMMPS